VGTVPYMLTGDRRRYVEVVKISSRRSTPIHISSFNKHIPPNIVSVVYVACTRTNKRQNLSISHIFPSIWERTEKSYVNKATSENNCG